MKHCDISSQLSNKLPSQGAGNNPFLSSIFWELCVKYFGSNKAISLFSTTGDDGWLLQKNSAFSYQTFLPSQAQISCLTGTTPSLTLNAFFKAHPCCLKLDLLYVDPDYLDADDLNSNNIETMYHGTTISIDLNGTFAGYWESRSKNLRKNTKKFIKRFDDDPDNFCLKVSSSPEDLKAAVARYGLLESRGWKGTNGTALHPDNEQGRFYNDFLQSYATVAQAEAFELYLNDELIASRLCVTTDKMMVILKTTYDESQKNLAPGRVLLYKIIEREYNLQRTQKIEFYTNATPDQIRWATDQRDIKHITVYRNAAVMKSFKLLKGIKNALLKPAEKDADTTEDSSPALACKWYKSIDEMDEDTRDLIKQSFSSYLFLGLSYFHIFEDKIAQKDNLDVIYLTILKDAKPIAILPLKQESKFLNHSLQSLTNYYFFRFNLGLHPAYKDEEEAVFRSIAQALKPFNTLHLVPVHEQDQLLRRFLKHLQKERWFIDEYAHTVNWTGSITTLEAYQEQLPSRLKNTVTRARKKLDQQGYSSELLTAPAAITQHLADYWQVYDKSWKINEPYPEFIETILQHYAELNQVVLAISYLETTPVSSQIWFIQDQTAYIYKLAYDKAYQKLSVGSVLTWDIIEYVSHNFGIKQLDFLNGDDNYKQDWMDTKADVSGFYCVQERSIIGKLLALLYKNKRFFKRFKSAD